MIILPRAAAGVSAARMISRERFAFDLEKFSQWEVRIRLLSFSARPHSCPSLAVSTHTHTHTHSLSPEEAFIMDDEGEIQHLPPSLAPLQIPSLLSPRTTLCDLRQIYF